MKTLLQAFFFLLFFCFSLIFFLFFLYFNPIKSFMTEVVIIYKPVHWFAEQINGLVFIWYNGLCHERVKCNFKLLITTSVEIQFKKRKFKNYFHVTDDMVCFNRPYSFKFFKGWLPLNLTWFILEYFVSIDHLILLLFGLVFIRSSLTQVIYKKLFWKILQNSQARSLLKRESDTGVL